MGAEIKKVTIQIGSKEIELTVEEAKELCSALGELFDKKIVREEHHHYPWRWFGPAWISSEPTCYKNGTVMTTYPASSGAGYSAGAQTIDVGFALTQFNIGFDDESGTMSLVKK